MGDDPDRMSNLVHLECYGGPLDGLEAIAPRDTMERARLMGALIPMEDGESDGFYKVALDEPLRLTYCGPVVG